MNYCLNMGSAELAVGNIVRRVLHIIREEDLSSTVAATGGLSLDADSDDDDIAANEDRLVLSGAALAAAARSTLRAPSLQTLLEDIPDSAAAPHAASSGGDSEGRSKCKFLPSLQYLAIIYKLVLAFNLRSSLISDVILILLIRNNI